VYTLAINLSKKNYPDPVTLNLFQGLIRLEMLKQVQHDASSIVC